MILYECPISDTVERGLKKLAKNLLLIGEIAKAGETRRSLAEQIGISETSLGNKINGKRDFTVAEAIRICEILHITDNAAKAQIFLA